MVDNIDSNKGGLFDRQTCRLCLEPFTLAADPVPACDYYTMFYYKFTKDNYGRDEPFWTHSIDTPARTAWTGFTFR